MSKVKTTIFLVLLLALVNIATSNKLKAQTQLQIDVPIAQIGNASEAQPRCSSACSAKNFEYMGRFSSKDGNTICVCSVNVGSKPIWNQSDAQKKCPQWCNAAGRYKWNGHWDTKVKMTLSVCGCY